MASVPRLVIHLSDKIQLEILERQSGSLFDEEYAEEHNEVRHQLVEGCFYDYAINDSNYFLGEVPGNIVQSHKVSKNLGTIAPNIFVGTLFIPVYRNGDIEPLYNIPLEVRSKKTDYRKDYRDMLEFITEKCTDLLLQVNSPVYQNFEPDFTKDISPEVLYQRFVFTKSIINSGDFADAVHQIVTSPVTTWKEETEYRDVRNLRRLSNNTIKQLVKGNNRTSLPENHYLYQRGLKSLPTKVQSSRKTDSLDTAENRFIKDALETFLKFCVEINAKAKNLKKGGMIEKESALLIFELESYLHHTVFNEISKPETLNLNSPVLQRKEGYREVLRVWLMFDLAAKLIWKGGDDVYAGGKKDIATLYEYWLFFKLLDLFQSLFKIEPAGLESLISISKDGLNVQLKQGKTTPLKGVYESGNRKFCVQFNYNRSFKGKNNYPDSGSWTTTLRPDYTLSVWPFGIDESQAEKEELIVHIHFDAKYKVDNLFQITDKDLEDELNEEKIENKKGIYKNADLLKMHAYKDAIRRTGGAYVLYPGTEKLELSGFHEIIPGLGAFAVRPSKSEEGTEKLKEFISKVIQHFMNRASQREKMALKSFQVYENPPNDEGQVDDFLPEAYGNNRHLIPDETYVLVGYCKSPEHAVWLEKEKKYNFRTGTGNGSLHLDIKTVTARYLLLHTSGDSHSNQLWKIVSKGPKVYSKGDLRKTNYPSPKHDFYLVIDLEMVKEPELVNQKWVFKELEGYKKGNASAYPFTCSLAELVRVKG